MRAEKFFAFIEKYLTGGLLLLLIGLVRSDRGMRGFPFAWMGPHTDVLRFFMSLIVLTAVIICADVIARAITAATEPKMQVLTRTQINIAKAAPAKTSVKPVRKKSSPDYRAKADRIAELRSLAERRAADAEPPLISEESVREFGKSLSRKASKALSSSGKNESSKMVGLFITILIAAISLATMFAALDPDDGFDSDSLIAEDEYEDPNESACQEYLDYILGEDHDSAESMLAGSADLADAVKWSEADYAESYWCAGYSTEDGYICRYIIDTDQSRYVMAMLLDDDSNIIGAELCECGDEDAFDSFGYASLDDGSLSEDEEEFLKDYVDNNALTAGITEAEDVSILLY